MATWLDGAVAGLGAAGVCACFAFNTILHSVGGDASTVTVAVDLAYPIGDVLLLILVVGGTTILFRPEESAVAVAGGRDRHQRRR